MRAGSAVRGRFRLAAAVAVAACLIVSVALCTPSGDPSPPAPKPAPAKKAVRKPSDSSQAWWSRMTRNLQGGRVGVLDVTGPIYESAPVISRIRWLTGNRMVRVMLLRIDSPGGDVGAVQEIVDELVKFRDGGRRPIVSSFAGVAASGGYYIACTSDVIFSNPGTLTGSIGVILEFPVAEQLLKKIGVEYVVIKSGRYKDSGNFARKMTPEEREIMQQTVEDVYEQFFDAVWEGRKDALKAAIARDSGRPLVAVREGEARALLRSLADGRVLSGKLAMESGLVDRLGGYEAALAEAGKLAGIRGRPGTLTPPRPRRTRSWADMLGGMLGLPEPSGASGRSSRVSLAYMLR